MLLCLSKHFFQVISNFNRMCKIKSKFYVLRLTLYILGIDMSFTSFYVLEYARTQLNKTVQCVFAGEFHNKAQLQYIFGNE